MCAKDFFQLKSNPICCSSIFCLIASSWWKKNNAISYCSAWYCHSIPCDCDSQQQQLLQLNPMHLRFFLLLNAHRWFLHLPLQNEQILMWETLCNCPAKKEGKEKTARKCRREGKEREAAATKLQDAAINCRTQCSLRPDQDQIRPSEQSDR